MGKGMKKIGEAFFITWVVMGCLAFLVSTGVIFAHTEVRTSTRDPLESLRIGAVLQKYDDTETYDFKKLDSLAQEAVAFLDKKAILPGPIDPPFRRAGNFADYSDSLLNLAGVTRAFASEFPDLLPKDSLPEERRDEAKVLVESLMSRRWEHALNTYYLYHDGRWWTAIWWLSVIPILGLIILVSKNN